MALTLLTLSITADQLREPCLKKSGWSEPLLSWVFLLVIWGSLWYLFLGVIQFYSGRVNRHYDGD